MDWNAIEADYRAGIKSLRQIADDHNRDKQDAAHVSHMSIARQSKKYGWARDLKQKIQQKAADKLARDAARESTNKKLREAAAKAGKESEPAIIEANAEVQAAIIRSHRKDVTRARGVCNRLMDELEVMTMMGHELEDLACSAAIEEGGSGADMNKRIAAFTKAVGNGSRITSMKALADALRILIGIEREAFGITVDKASTPYEEMLRALNGE